jgi:carboxylate-amine ligase
MEHGTSAERQMRVYEQTGDLKAVVKHIVAETRGGVVEPMQSTARGMD